MGLLAVAALILVSPASTSAATASVTLPAGTSPTGADALEVSSYQDDFEVSKQTAEERLEVQEDGAGIVEQLEGTQGNRYAGVWFDNESGEFVVPTVAGAGGPSVATALAGSYVEGDFRTKPVQSSWDELEAAQERIDSALLPLIEEGLIGTSLDPRVNAVVIKQAEAANGSQRVEVQAVARGESVEVEVRESQDRKLGVSPEACQSPASVCDAPMRGGVNIVPSGGLRGTGCTAGFKATGKTYGNRFVLTAGHCVVNSGATKWDSFSLAPETRRNLGYAEAYSYPVHDYAAINANGTYWDKPSWPTIVTYWGVNQEYPIYNESSSYIGEYVCHAGQKSGLSCGTVTGTNLTEPSEGSGGYLYNLTRFEHICTIEGDSGGPVFTPGNVALGIYSSSDKPKGAENPCYYNGYYTEITEDTDALGVSVAPRITPPPPAWHSEHVAGNTTMNPAIAAPYPSSLNLVSRGSDGALYYKTGLEGSGWSEWAPVAGGTGVVASSPSASSWGEGRLDIAARMSDNSIMHWYWTGSAWYSEKIAGNMRGTPAIVDVDPGHIDLVAQGSDNALYFRSWYQGSGWTEWAPLGSGTGAVFSSPAATSWGTGRLDVVARASNNSINHWYWDGSWHSENIAGNMTSAPALSTSNTGLLDLVARGTDSYLYRRAWNASTGWTEWGVLAGGAGPVPDGAAIVSPYPTRLDIVARDSDNSIDHWFWK